MTGRSHLVNDRCWCGQSHTFRPIHASGATPTDFTGFEQPEDLGIPPIVTTSYIPVYLPDRVVIGKATVVESLNDAAVIIEVECNPSITPGLVKEGLVGVSFVYEAGVPAQGENDGTHSKDSDQEE